MRQGTGGGEAAGAAKVNDEGSKEEVGGRGLAVEAARGSGVGSSSPWQRRVAAARERGGEMGIGRERGEGLGL